MHNIAKRQTHVEQAASLFEVEHAASLLETVKRWFVFFITSLLFSGTPGSGSLIHY
jgi:hypothetical protein